MTPARPPALRVGIDTGGTFTDIVWSAFGSLGTAKMPSTPHAPAQAVLDGLGKAPAGSRLVCHGTTVGTNSVLARTGGPACMVVTSGFRDALEIGRGEREHLYSRAPSRPRPLLTGDRIFEIDLRMDAAGNSLSTPGDRDISDLARGLSESGAMAVAVGILHSAAFPDSERELAARLTDLTGIPAFPSARLAAYPREYERWSLAALAAYLFPVLGRYLSELTDRCPASLALMASSGGLLSPEKALDNPALCVLSGPAGGALAAMSLGCERVLGLDMGGTSTDVTLLAGRIPRTREAAIAGLPLPLPTIDIHTIGAGGGSIVKVDPGGILGLGPESAGASPGPACYGNGGPATLSDVALLSGRLVASRFLGGEMRIDERAAAAALDEVRPVGMTVDGLLDGVLDLAKVHLVGALRRISVARGVDPSVPESRFALVPFGGAGALFGVECARALGLREVLHPVAAGVFSAIGLLQAPLSVELERAILRNVGESIEPILTAQSELKDELRRSLEEWEEDVEPVFSTTLECRYLGQTHALEIPLPGRVDAAEIRRDFESEYESRYTYLHHDAEVEIVAIRVRGEIPAPAVEFPDINGSGRSLDSAIVGSTALRLDGAWRESPVYDRNLLPTDTPVDGPALIVEDFCTLYLPPDTSAHITRKGHAVMEID